MSCDNRLAIRQMSLVTCLQRATGTFYRVSHRSTAVQVPAAGFFATNHERTFMEYWPANKTPWDSSYHSVRGLKLFSGCFRTRNGSGMIHYCLMDLLAAWQTWDDELQHMDNVSLPHSYVNPVHAIASGRCISPVTHQSGPIAVLDTCAQKIHRGRCK